MKTAAPPPDADFLVYYEGSKVLLKPQNSTASEYVETTLARDGLRWLSGALVIKDTSVIPLTHKLIAAGFNVVGESALVQTRPRLYVHNGKWCLYTGGHVMSPEVVDQILKHAGSPN